MGKILFVDDEQNILDGYKRALRKDFQIETALSGGEALEALQDRSNYAVIVSDMRMPEMDGVTFLLRATEVCPDSVRIMLTGNADQQTAVDAVNKGSIFRFLNKPCPPETMAVALRAGIEQHRLNRLEKELMEKTMSATIQTLTDILSLVNPTAFSRATRVRHLVRQITSLLKVEKAWQVELAAMLSQIGCITIPEEILQKVYHGQELHPDELHLLQSHPQVGYDLIAKIPRLKPVAEIIAHQEERFNGITSADDDNGEEVIPLGARILKVALDLDKLIEAKITYSEACREIERREGWYDPQVVASLMSSISSEPEVEYETQIIAANDLEPNMILAEDVLTTRGTLLVASTQEVTPSLCFRVKKFAETGFVKNTVKILVPVENKEAATN